MDEAFELFRRGRLSDEAFEMLLARLHVALGEKIQFVCEGLAELRPERKRVRLALRGLLRDGAPAPTDEALST